MLESPSKTDGAEPQSDIMPSNPVLTITPEEQAALERKEKAAFTALANSRPNSAYKKLSKLAPTSGDTVQITDSIALKIPKKHASLTLLKGQDWRVRAIQAKQEWGKFLTGQVIGRIQLVGCMTVLAQAEKAIDMLQNLSAGIATDKDGKVVDLVIRAEDRVKASIGVSESAERYVNISLEVVRLAEMSNGRQDDGSNRPKNKPPSLGIETTSPDGTMTRVVATSGETSP